MSSSSLHPIHSMTQVLETVEFNIKKICQTLKQTTDGSTELEEQIKELNNKRLRALTGGELLTTEEVNILSVYDFITGLYHQIIDEEIADEYLRDSFFENEIKKTTYNGVASDLATVQPWADMGRAATFLSQIRDLLVLTVKIFKNWTEHLKEICIDPSNPQYIASMKLLHAGCFPNVIKWNTADENKALEISHIAQSAEVTYETLARLYVADSETIPSHHAHLEILKKVEEKQIAFPGIIGRLLEQIKTTFPFPMPSLSIDDVRSPIRMTMTIESPSERNSPATKTSRCDSVVYLITCCGLFCNQKKQNATTPSRHYTLLPSP